MKVLEEKKVTVELTKEEVNALIYGLNEIIDKDYLADTVEYWGMGGQRQFKAHKLRDLLLQFSDL